MLFPFCLIFLQRKSKFPFWRNYTEYMCQCFLVHKNSIRTWCCTNVRSKVDQFCCMGNFLSWRISDRMVDLLYCSTTTLGMPINGSYIRDQMQKVIDKEGLPDVVFHSLRHTSVTYKLKLNIKCQDRMYKKYYIKMYSQSVCLK